MVVVYEKSYSITKAGIDLIEEIDSLWILDREIHCISNTMELGDLNIKGQVKKCKLSKNSIYHPITCHIIYTPSSTVQDKFIILFYHFRYCNVIYFSFDKLLIWA